MNHLGYSTGEMGFARADEWLMDSRMTLVLLWGVCGGHEDKQRFKKEVNEAIVKKGIMDVPRQVGKEEIHYETAH